MCKPKIMLLVIRAISLLGLSQAACMGAVPLQAPSAPAAVSMPATVKSTLLRDDPQLQEKLSVEVTNRALGDVLADLSRTLKIDLTASPQVADQRVTLHLTDQPLYRLMGRLPQLLSHLPDKPHGYYWEKLERPANSRPAFNLWRDLRSVQDEQYAHGYPRREAAVLLRDMRNLCRLTPKERESYKGDFPFIRFPGVSPTEDGPEAKAMRDLTDAQIDALLDGERIPLDPALFPTEIAEFKQQRRQNYLRIHNIPAEKDASVPALPDIPPAISVSQADSNGNNPDKETRYHLDLEGIVSYSSNIDVYDTNAHPDPSRVPPVITASTDKAMPVVDLTPRLTDKAVTEEQRSSLSFTLQALAQAAHINVYGETFLKQPYVTYNVGAGRLTTLKGTLPSLIAAICKEWNYQAQKAGDDYIFWSQTWAQDRAADVPDRLIHKWRERQQKQGALSLADNAEIAATLTWPQIGLTLNQALPELRMGPSEYDPLRLIGLLSPLESQAAFSAEGLALAQSSPWVQQAFAGDLQQQAAKAAKDFVSDDSVSVEFKRQPTPVTSDEYAQAVLTVRADEPWDLSSEPKQKFWVNVGAGERELFREWIVISLPPPGKQTPRKQTDAGQANAGQAPGPPSTMVK